MEREGWQPTRWWRALGADGELWCESSDEQEVREAVRPGDRVEHLWSRTEYDWRPA
jgi:hypothetical protein